MLERAMVIFNVADVVALLQRTELKESEYEAWFSVVLSDLYYLNTTNHFYLSWQERYRLLRLSDEASQCLYRSAVPPYHHYYLYANGWDCHVRYFRYSLTLDLR